jgi:rare lipoprotein A (peptidoglycan hydrolase)
MKAKLLLLLGLALPAVCGAQAMGLQKSNSVATRHATKKLRHSTTHNVKIVWCDLHVCNEKVRPIGKASYYGKGYWQGRKMANGQPFDYTKLTMACWWLPLGTQARVTNLENGLSVIVEVTDRGPAHVLHRVADLSQAAAEVLDYTAKGLATVLITPVPALLDTVESPITASLVEPDPLLDFSALFPPSQPLPPAEDNRLYTEDFQY